MLKLCKDALSDDRGWILVLDDTDIKSLLKSKADHKTKDIHAFMNNLMRELVM